MSQSPQQQLEARKAQLLSEISTAARAGNTGPLLSATDDLRRVEEALTRLRDVHAEVHDLLGRRTTAPARVTALPPGGAGREIGPRVRSDFLARARQAGIVLSPDRGAIYRSPRGRRVGTAVATERHKNRWFLGLGEDAFDAAVLLCVPESGAVLDICIPKAFFDAHSKHLSRAGGQIKFNVARRGANVILKIPRQSPVVVDGFIKAYSQLDV